MAVIKDVAHLAGLSVPAVSKYLRNPESVRVDTKERIERAIRELNYMPSTAARALRIGRTGMLSVAMPDITNPFFAELSNVIQKEAAAQGYTVLLQASGGIDQTSSVVSGAYAVPSVLRVDGVILCFPDDEAFIPAFAERLGKVPMLLLSWRPTQSVQSSVLLDIRGGIYKTVMHLIAKGHERIAYIGGPAHSVISREKYKGFELAVKESGLWTDPKLVYHGLFSMETGYKAAEAFLRLPEPPTAVVAENDIIAVGCIKLCLKKSIHIPEQIAVAGFDDIPLARMYEPTITTARPPLQAIGAAAVRQIREIIDNPENRKQTEPIVFETELIIRRSTDLEYADTI